MRHIERWKGDLRHSQVLTQTMHTFKQAHYSNHSKLKVGQRRHADVRQTQPVPL